MGRRPQHVIQQRISDVVRLLLAGAELDDIRQYALQCGWNVGQRQLQRYVESAYDHLLANGQQNKEKLLARHLAQRRAIYARSLKNNDMRTALQVLRDEAALQGLYPPTKVAPTSPDGNQSYDAFAVKELLRLAEETARGPVVIRRADLQKIVDDAPQEVGNADDETPDDPSS